MASSIAEVFEEAANKVELEKKETEKRYLDNVKQLEGVIAKVKKSRSHNSTCYTKKNSFR